jgi:hypothetical protein
LESLLDTATKHANNEPLTSAEEDEFNRDIAKIDKYDENKSYVDNIKAELDSNRELLSKLEENIEYKTNKAETLEEAAVENLDTNMKEKNLYINMKESNSYSNMEEADSDSDSNTNQDDLPLDDLPLDDYIKTAFIIALHLLNKNSLLRKLLNYIYFKVIFYYSKIKNNYKKK